MTSERERMKYGLPSRVFYFTIEQIAEQLQVSETYVKQSLLHYEGRSHINAPRDKIKATNFAPEGERPVWRVSERDFIRFLRLKGDDFARRKMDLDR